MGKDVYEALKQSQVNRRQKRFNIAIALVVLACVVNITRLDEKIDVFKFKNSDGVSENTKGE